MKGIYIPDYAPSQIVVEFKDYLSEYGIRDICEKSRLRIIGNSPLSKYHYIIQTEPGKEKETIEKLSEECLEFIQSVELRD